MNNNKKIIDSNEIRHIAHLARIELRPGDTEKFSKDLCHILEYVNTLAQVNTENVEPAFSNAPLSNVFREDYIQPSLSVEEVLANAPCRHENYFKMPRILNQSDNS